MTVKRSFNALLGCVLPTQGMRNALRWIGLQGGIVCLVVFGYQTALAQSSQVLDEVVAVVNEQVITKSRLAKRVAIAKRQMAANPNAPAIPSSQLNDQVLNAMINEAVMQQYASTNRMNPSEREINAALALQMEDSGLKPMQFEEKLAQEGLSKEVLRDQFRMQYIVSQIRNQVVAPTITVRAAEIDAFLSERMGDRTAKPEVSVAHLVIKTPENASEEDLKKAQSKLALVQQSLVAGSEFSDVAAKFSDFSDAKAGGLIGWRPRERLPDFYLQALEKMKPGDVSAPIVSSNGIHLIKFIEERDRAQQIVERIRARHILLRVSDPRADRATLQELEQIARRIHGGEDFTQLARRFSNDGSATQGGDLGWLYPGDTVSEFEQTIAKLPLNTLSQPVRTTYGWHLIEVVAREAVPLPEEKARQLAKRVLTDEKLNTAFRHWLEEQVANAYLLRPSADALTSASRTWQ